MATVMYSQVIVSVLMILLVSGVSASMDGGDVAAMLIGLFIGVLGICSCLGWYARKRSAHH